MVRRKLMVGAVGGLLTLPVSAQVFAFSCPALQKAANESIAQAESAVGNIKDDREKGRAMTNIALAKEWVQQSVADHKEAGAKKDAELHYRSEAKAKAAKALADLVK
jgi:hypothetical protein